MRSKTSSLKMSARNRNDYQVEAVQQRESHRPTGRGSPCRTGVTRNLMVHVWIASPWSSFRQKNRIQVASVQYQSSRSLLSEHLLKTTKCPEGLYTLHSCGTLFEPAEEELKEEPFLGKGRNLLQSHRWPSPLSGMDSHARDAMHTENIGDGKEVFEPRSSFGALGYCTLRSSWTIS